MKRTLLLWSCLLFLPTQLYSAELAKDGATSWKIVLPDEPTIVEKTAARELSEHLKLVTGADFQTTAAVISQEKNFGLYLKSLKAGFIAQKNLPEICKDVPEDAWVVFDALSFNNYNNAATIIDDVEGWNGKSVRMGTKVDWNTSYTPPVRGKYRLLASLRCEGTVKEGKLGSWGVYDVQGKKSLKSMALYPKVFTTEDGSFDKKFRWIDLGVIDFVPSAYFWFAHGHHPELDAIFVDRVVLIGAE